MKQEVLTTIEILAQRSTEQAQFFLDPKRFFHARKGPYQEKKKIRERKRNEAPFWLLCRANSCWRGELVRGVKNCSPRWRKVEGTKGFPGSEQRKPRERGKIKKKKWGFRIKIAPTIRRTRR